MASAAGGALSCAHPACGRLLASAGERAHEALAGAERARDAAAAAEARARALAARVGAASRACECMDTRVAALLPAARRGLGEVSAAVARTGELVEQAEDALALLTERLCVNTARARLEGARAAGRAAAARRREQLEQLERATEELKFDVSLLEGASRTREAGGEGRPAEGASARGVECVEPRPRRRGAREKVSLEDMTIEVDEDQSRALDAFYDDDDDEEEEEEE